VKQKPILLRVALDSNGDFLVLDQSQRLKGRGAYICPDCLPQFRFTKRVQRAFRNRAKQMSETMLYQIEARRQSRTDHTVERRQGNAI
jgi:predicted RNA-binding protein YlxR (DUF448 family)